MSAAGPFLAELHCHSSFSRDCAVSLPKIIELCGRRGLKIIALTDHNEIAGAQELQAMAPDWLTVIVGEEIATAEGDLIGLFLKERIKPRLPIEETIAEIKQQGGLVLLPHPFDRIRREAVGKVVLEHIKNRLDGLEVYNSRCLWPADNRLASSFAARHNLTPFVGSDAHTVGEYGRSVVSFKSRPTTAAEFKAALASASLIKKWSNPLVHGRTFVVKRVKRRR